MLASPESLDLSKVLSKESLSEIEVGFINRGFLNDNGLEELQAAAGYKDTALTPEIDANAGDIPKLGSLWRSRVALEISQYQRTPKEAQRVASAFVNEVSAKRGTIEDGPSGTVLKILPDVSSLGEVFPRTPEQHKAVQITGLFNAMLAGNSRVPDIRTIQKYTGSGQKWGLLTDNSELGKYRSGSLPYLLTTGEGTDLHFTLPGNWEGMRSLVEKARERGVNPLQWGTSTSFALAFNEAYQDALSARPTSRVIDAVTDQMFTPTRAPSDPVAVTVDSILDRLKVKAPSVNPVTLK